MPNDAPQHATSTDTAQLPPALYVWLVPSEHMLDQPGSWRIRKWDTEPFPEATHAIRAGQGEPVLWQSMDEEIQEIEARAAASEREWKL